MYYQPVKQYGWVHIFAWCVFFGILVSVTFSLDWFREYIANVTGRKIKTQQILCDIA